MKFKQCFQSPRADTAYTRTCQEKRGCFDLVTGYKYRSRNSVNHHPKHGALAPNYPYLCAVTVRCPPQSFLTFSTELDPCLTSQFRFFGGDVVSSTLSTYHKSQNEGTRKSLYQWNAVTTKDDDRGVTKLHHCKKASECDRATGRHPAISWI